MSRSRSNKKKNFLRKYLISTELGRYPSTVTLLYCIVMRRRSSIKLGRYMRHTSLDHSPEPVNVK